jgi:hypothetical protein
MSGNLTSTGRAWIPCSERMPEPLANDWARCVIVATKYGTVLEAYSHPHWWMADGGITRLALEEVTHWQPMPEHPND